MMIYFGSAPISPSQFILLLSLLKFVTNVPSVPFIYNLTSTSTWFGIKRNTLFYFHKTHTVKPGLNTIICTIHYTYIIYHISFDSYSQCVCPHTGERGWAPPPPPKKKLGAYFLKKKNQDITCFRTFSFFLP